MGKHNVPFKGQWEEILPSLWLTKTVQQDLYLASQLDAKWLRNVDQMVFGTAVCFQDIDNLCCCLQTMVPVSYLRAVQTLSVYL